METSQDWRTGSFSGTRLTDSGNLALQDYAVAKDDFAWSNPSESQFDWRIGTRNGGELETASSENRIVLNTTGRFDLVELTSALQVDFNSHSTWALEFTAETTEPHNTNTLEFFFLNGGGQGNVEYFIMYDMGGASETHDNPDDTCREGGDSPFNRDQLLYRNDKTDMKCWDGFADRPIDWSQTWHGELRVDFSSGIIKAYRNNELQADLRVADDQPMPPQTPYRIWVKNHNKGGSSDLVLHDMALRKMGEYQESGNFTGIVDAGQPVEWTDVEVVGNFPTGTDYEMRYAPAKEENMPHTGRINKLEETRYIKYTVTLTTKRRSKTPQVDKIRFLHDN